LIAFGPRIQADTRTISPRWLAYEAGCFSLSVIPLRLKGVAILTCVLVGFWKIGWAWLLD